MAAVLALPSLLLLANSVFANQEVTSQKPLPPSTGLTFNGDVPKARQGYADNIRPLFLGEGIPSPARPFCPDLASGLATW